MVKNTSAINLPVGVEKKRSLTIFAQSSSLIENIYGPLDIWGRVEKKELGSTWKLKRGL